MTKNGIFLVGLKQSKMPTTKTEGNILRTLLKCYSARFKLSSSVLLTFSRSNWNSWLWKKKKALIIHEEKTNEITTVSEGGLEKCC